MSQYCEGRNRDMRYNSAHTAIQIRQATVEVTRRFRLMVITHPFVQHTGICLEILTWDLVGDEGRYL